MQRYKCDIVNGVLFVERFSGEPFYLKFTLDLELIKRRPKRVIIITDYKIIIYDLTMTFSYLSVPLILRNKISKKNLDFLFKNAKV